MDQTLLCSNCGVALPAATVVGLCPVCVDAVTIDEPQASPSSVQDAATLPPRAQQSDASPGPPRRQFGNYEIVEEIARGGMGVVYKARQTSLNRTVALKMILSGQWATPDARQRFRQEAEAAANLQHPNIVGIHEVGEHDGQQFFSMDFVDGRSLAELVRTGPLSTERAAACVKSIAEAVHFAHQRGILHRDLKPQNVLVDSDDRPHITDFGLAKRVADDSGLTRTGDVLGSPSYMSPEQASSQREDLGPTSDIYSLGAILYELLTGRAPFTGTTTWETLCQVIQSPPVPPRKLNPSVPRDLETICLKCLEKSPAQRFASAQDLADELGRYLNGERILSSPRRLEPAPPARWVGAALGIGAMAGLLSGLLGWPSSFVPGSTDEHSSSAVGRLVLGGLLCGLAASVGVGIWNTLVLPAWLLRYTAAPLAKASLGLWLILDGVVLSVAVLVGALLSPFLGIDEGSSIAAILALRTVAYLLTLLGPIFCLEIGQKARSAGLLLFVIVLEISALVIGAIANQDKETVQSSLSTVSSLLTLACVPLFAIFLIRLARALERTELEQKARTLLKNLVWAIAFFGSMSAVAAVREHIPHALSLIVPISTAILTPLGVLIFFPLLFIRSLNLIRALQREIAQRV
jgi:serine/threonine protein kinase